MPHHWQAAFRRVAELMACDQGSPGDVLAATGRDQSQRPDVEGTDEAAMILLAGEDAQRACYRVADVADAQRKDDRQDEADQR